MPARRVNHHFGQEEHLTTRPFVKAIGALMVRWITFDDETAAAVVSNVASGTAEIRDGDAFLTAISEGDCTLVLPSDTAGQVFFLQIRINANVNERKPPASVHLDAPAQKKAVGEDVSYEAVGFLGLSDSPVFEEEPRRPKKWWQRLLD